MSGDYRIERQVERCSYPRNLVQPDEGGRMAPGVVTKLVTLARGSE